MNTMNGAHRVINSAESEFGRWIEGGLEHGRAVSFRFDGKTHAALAGDSLASALLANNVRLLGRSFKYHRPRGLLAAGCEEPNALVGVGHGIAHEPNLRATQVELHDGLEAVSQNRWPTLRWDAGGLLEWGGRLFPAGFYYKTFLWPRSFWHPVYERAIRRIAGLGRLETAAFTSAEADAPLPPAADDCEQIHMHCDVLVVGAGLAGIAAAKAAAASGARVILADEAPHPGGRAWEDEEKVQGLAAWEWAMQEITALQERGNFLYLRRTIACGHYDHNLVLLLERAGEHDPVLLARPGAIRRRLWRVRPKRIVLAAGALERPLLFAHNDRPGVMLSSSVRAYLRRYGVAAGSRAVVATCHDDAYLTALDLKNAGVDVACIVDLRPSPHNMRLSARVQTAGIALRCNSALWEVEGRRGVRSVMVGRLRESGRPALSPERITCDLVAMSGGFTPTVHLWSHAGGTLQWEASRSAFFPESHPQRMLAAGAVLGIEGCEAIRASGEEAGGRAVEEIAGESGAHPEAQAARILEAPAPIPRHKPVGRLIPGRGSLASGRKHFLDFQNDVTVADVELAAREGYRSVELLKRYTTTGMATDQGKTSNLNALEILSDCLSAPTAQLGVTTFRPPYTPLPLDAITGMNRGALFAPRRRTPITSWHEANGWDPEPVGQWLRPYCYRRGEEGRRQAIEREIKTTRSAAGMIDLSTLGKIEVQGADAGAFLDRIYTNVMANLPVGRCRYGLMLNENGFLFDDGVVVRLAEDRFLLHTTSGNADTIHAWLEEWHQTEWFDLDLFITPVGEQWAQIGLAGPQARAILQSLESDIDFAAEDFPFLSMRAGVLAGMEVRIHRISFTGELSYEIAVPARCGLAMWERLLQAGAQHGICAFGTEALHIMRAEKGFIVIGDETDGQVTPQDLGLGWAVSKKKADFIGKRGLQRSHLASDGRPQLTGLFTEDENLVLPDGAYAIDPESKDAKGHPRTIGHVTSSYWSPTLQRSIAMALVENARARRGENITIALEEGPVQAKLVDCAFYDPKGERQNA